MLKLIHFIFFLFSFLFVSAQQFGGNPPSLKWKQLNSDTARIIYPAGLDSQAQRVSTVVHYLAANDHSLGNRLKKINIVLQNQTTIANGYVALGPYRSEFFMTPSMNNFDLGSLDWPTQLALHEYRHVQQFNNFKTGLSKFMSYLMGEDGLALAINAAVPDWFYEGDAVYNETVYSEQGRGRIPFFTNQYPAIWQAGKNYSWMKLRNNSLKDYVPGHYPLGYLLVNYGYEKYGSGFWEKVTQRAAAYKSLFYPFQYGIKKETGLKYHVFRKEALDFYKKDSSELLMSNGASQVKRNQGSGAGEQKITSPTLKYVTNYFFPYSMENESLLYLKSSYRKRPAFVIKDNAGEHVLRIKDISLDEQFSYRNGKIIYAAYKPDVRWGWRNYSELRLLDAVTGKQKKLTHRSRYFSPDISGDGKKVATVHYDVYGKSELHILDATSGEIIQRIHSGDISLFSDPKFIDGNSVVTCARFADGNMTLMLANIASGSLKRLTPPAYNVIGYPSIYKGKIYFTASYAGNDDVFVLQLSDNKIFRVTQSATGNYFVNASESKLIYSNFTAEGYQLKSFDLINTGLQEVDSNGWRRPANKFPIAHAGSFKAINPADIAGRNFTPGKYKKGTKPINFHSWWPYYEDPEFTFSVYGENVLNTLQTELYYLYNQNDKTNAFGLSTVYGAWFPYLSGGVEYTINRTDTFNRLTREWNQLDTRIGLNIPLNFSGDRFFRFLNFGSSYVFRIENNTGPNKNSFAENNFSYLSHFLTYSQFVETARQHIYPRFGFTASMQLQDAISYYNSYQFITSGNIFLPGFLSTHSIVLNGSFQQRDTLRALFSNRFAYSRGYNEFYFSRMWKLAGNYHFPVWLPDWGFANLLYFQRIRANVFYDFTKVYSRNKKVTADQRSTGVEIYADTRWWNSYPLTFGFRIGRLLDIDFLTGQKRTFFEFILPVSLVPR